MYQNSVNYGAGVSEICEIRRGCIRTLFYTRWVYQNSVLYKVGVSEICVIQRGYIKTLIYRARVYENSDLQSAGVSEICVISEGLVTESAPFWIVLSRTKPSHWGQVRYELCTTQSGVAKSGSFAVSLV